MAGSNSNAVRDDPGVNVGYLRIPMDARFSVRDGQHWIAAIEAVLAANAKLANETISAVLIPDVGLKRCRQVFADLARYSIRTSASLALLDDQRDEAAQLAKGVMSAVPFFAELTETEKSSISNRSTKLFTLSAIHGAVQTLLAGLEIRTLEERRSSWQPSSGSRSASTSPPGNWLRNTRSPPPICDASTSMRMR